MVTVPSRFPESGDTLTQLALSVTCQSAVAATWRIALPALAGTSSCAGVTSRGGLVPTWVMAMVWAATPPLPAMVMVAVRGL